MSQGTAGGTATRPSASAGSRLGVVSAMQAAAFAKDWDRFKSMFAADVYYRVGNVKEVTGPEAVASYLRDLPSTGFTITRMDVRGAWESGAAAVAEYTMQALRDADGRAVEYPCVDIYRFQGDQFSDWRVYAIEPTFVADPGSITLKRPTGASPGAAGAMPDSFRIVGSFQEALRTGNASLAQSMLTDDALVRVADRPEVRGPDAILGQIQEIFTKRLRPSGAEILAVWEFEGALIVEMIVQATRAHDGRAVEYPCVESYRLEGGKLREWRIYPLESTLLATEG